MATPNGSSVFRIFCVCSFPPFIDSFILVNGDQSREASMDGRSELHVLCLYNVSWFLAIFFFPSAFQQRCQCDPIVLGLGFSVVLYIFWPFWSAYVLWSPYCIPFFRDDIFSSTAAVGATPVLQLQPLLLVIGHCCNVHLSIEASIHPGHQTLDATIFVKAFCHTKLRIYSASQVIALSCGYVGDASAV